MPEEHHLTARNLLEQMNRQFNECNALYHELAVHYGVSDTVFWLLYSLYNSSEPQTQNRLCMEWNLPKQTMNSAVASMVKQGLLELEPAPGRYSGKPLHLDISDEPMKKGIITNRNNTLYFCRFYIV